MFAEFERAMIRERVLAGLKRARAKGRTLGRPTISPAKERAIRPDLNAGLGFRRIMARHKVGTSPSRRSWSGYAKEGPARPSLRGPGALDRRPQDRLPALSLGSCSPKALEAEHLDHAIPSLTAC